MIPPTYNLTLYRGDTGRWQFKLWADAAKTVPVDLFGVTASAMIRDKVPTSSYTMELECSIIPPNTIEMVLDADASRDLPSSGVWDLQTLWPNGDVISIVKGPVSVTQDVTYVGAARGAAKVAIVK